MRKTKKFLSLLLTLAMLFGTMVVPSTAAEGDVISGSCGDNLTYTLTEQSDGNYKMVISGSGAMNDYDIRNNKAPWYSNRTNITSVSLSDGITYIGKYAFYGCAFTNVVIPDSVESIAAYAFYRCTQLSEITIPASVTSINSTAFNNCSALTEIKYEGTTEQWLAFNINTNANITCSDSDTVAVLSFATEPENAVIVVEDVDGNKVIDIQGKYIVSKGGIYTYTVSANAYLDVSGTINSAKTETISVKLEDDPSPVAVLSGNYGDSLTYELIRTITENNTVCELKFTGSGAMTDQLYAGGTPWNSNYADKITSIILPEGLTHIGSYAFSGCTNVTSVNIPDSVVSIGDYAFSDCKKLNRINLPDNLETLGLYAFKSCESLTSMTVPKGVNVLSQGVFQNCSALTSVVLTDSLTSIDSYAFYGCAKLSSVMIPSSVKTIGSCAFQNCVALTSAVIPEGVTIIPMCIFRGCSGLTSVTLPSTITQINALTFDECSNLTSINFNGTTAQWLAVSINKNNSGLNSMSINCSDSDSIVVFTFIVEPEDASVCVKDSDNTEVLSTTGNVYALEKNKNYTYIVSYSGYISESGNIDLNEKEKTVSLEMIPIFITTQPEDCIYDAGSNDVDALIVEAEGEDLTYQWYVNTVESYEGASAIENACESSYIPDVSEVGIKYYYCKITSNDLYLNTDIAAVTAEDTTPVSLVSGACGSSLKFEIIKTGVNYALNISGTGVIGDYDSMYDLPWADYRDKITSVNMAEGITSISNNAFRGFSKLKSVSFPEGVTNIGSYVIRDCKNITEIYLPSTLKTLETNSLMIRAADFSFKPDISVYYNGTPNSWDLVDGRDTGMPTNGYVSIYTLYYNAYALTFNVTPDGAAIAVTDKDGTTVQPYTDGKYYIIKGESCSYTVSKEGYSTVNETITLSDDNEINVVLKENETGAFKINIPAAEGGSTVASTEDTALNTADAGDVVKLNFSANIGYEVVSVNVTDANGDVVTVNGNSFIMPSSNVTVSVVFKENWYGLGMETKQYTVSTETELRQFASVVNGTDPLIPADSFEGSVITLGNEISLSEAWIPAGSVNNPFKGTFDGADKKISNFKIDYSKYNKENIYIGLFGVVESAVVKDLTVEGVINITIYDENSNDFKAVYAGGVVSKADYSTISGCVANVTITADEMDGAIGGIVAAIKGTDSEFAKVTGCKNLGNISVTKNIVSAAIGGIVGSANMTDISECTNTAILDSEVLSRYTDGNISGWYYFASGYQGGILGYGNDSYVIVEKSSNRGDITGAGCYMGGIAGYNKGNIINSYNVADITGDTTDVLKGSYPNLGGIAGNAANITNCYSIGEVSSTATLKSVGAIVADESSAEITNCYTGDSESFKASDLGDSSWKDVDGCYPILNWQNDSDAVKIKEAVYHNVTLPAGSVAQGYVTVSSDETVVKEGGSFSFSVAVFNSAYTVLVEANGNKLKASKGVYTIENITSDVTVTITLVESGLDSDTVIVNDSSMTDGIYTITKGGKYKLEEGLAGTIRINTKEGVTVIGNGAEWDEEYTMTSAAHSGLYFDCTNQAGVNLTLKDFYISNKNTPVLNCVDGTTCTFMGFTGVGNTLNFEGVNVIDNEVGGGTNPGVIHVKQGDSLTIGGSGTLYFYKSTQGAGIGGSSGELNGDITFKIAKMFAKGTKQGALIGAGSNSASAEGAPGSVTFESGEYNLISNSRGAVIGGSAGAGGGSSGTTVYVKKNANININVDYSGAAVGGGGYAEGNDSSGGTLYIDGGSLRTYVDTNAANNTNTGYNGAPFTAGINDAAITAERKNSNEENVYKCIVDTSKLETAAKYFNVKIDGTDYYSGGLHKYGFVQEQLDKGLGEQISINSTPLNWYDNDDTKLYFYLTGEDHEIEINGEKFTAVYDESALESKEVYTAGAFSVSKGAASGGDDENISISIGNGSAAGTTVDGVTTFKAGTSENAPTVTVTAPENGWKAGENTFTVSAEKACTVIVKNADGTYTKLAAAAVSDADNTYSFTTSESFDADCEIIVSMTGDIDGDGAISQADYLSVLSAIRGASLEGAAALRADVNSDDSISQVDYLSILSAIRGASLNW